MIKKLLSLIPLVSRRWRQRALIAENKLASALIAAQRSRNVAWPKPARRLSAKEVASAMDVPMDSALWTALHQELDDFIGDVLDEITQDPGATLTAERRLHLAGGAEYLRRFQKRLLDIHASNNTDIEEGDDDER